MNRRLLLAIPFAALALGLAPDPKVDRPEGVTPRAVYGAPDQLIYELYTLALEEPDPEKRARQMAPWIAAGIVVAEGTRYRDLPLDDSEQSERPRCARIRILYGEHRGRVVFVVREHLGPRKAKAEGGGK